MVSFIKTLIIFMYLFEERLGGGGYEGRVNYRAPRIPGRREVGPRVTVEVVDTLDASRQEEAIRELIRQGIETRGTRPAEPEATKVESKIVTEERAGLTLTDKQILGSDFYDLKWSDAKDNELKRAAEVLQEEAKKTWRGFWGLSAGELNRRIVYVGGIIGKRSVPEAVRQSNMAEVNRQRELRSERHNGPEIPEAK